MTEPWIQDFKAQIVDAVRAWPGPEGESGVVGALRAILVEAIGQTLLHAERLCHEHKDAALESAQAVRRPEEQEVHRRRALEAQRIAEELAAFRQAVRSGDDITAELRALAAAQGVPSSLDGPLPDTPPELEDGDEPDMEAIGGLLVDAVSPGDLEPGEHTIKITVGALARPSLESLLRIGRCSLELAGPVRVIAGGEDRGAGGWVTSRLEVSAAAGLVCAVVPGPATDDG